MINVHLLVIMKFPYHKSSAQILKLVYIWRGRILRLSTNKKYADILLPVQSFKKIFGENPQIKKYDVPYNTTSFIEEIEVTNIIVK